MNGPRLGDIRSDDVKYRALAVEKERWNGAGRDYCIELNNVVPVPRNQE